jgi:hypothetical protein
VEWVSVVVCHGPTLQRQPVPDRTQLETSLSSGAASAS